MEKENDKSSGPKEIITIYEVPYKIMKEYLAAQKEREKVKLKNQ